jgi:hypothetical protein
MRPRLSLLLVVFLLPILGLAQKPPTTSPSPSTPPPPPPPASHTSSPAPSASPSHPSPASPTAAPTPKSPTPFPTSSQNSSARHVAPEPKLVSSGSPAKSSDLRHADETRLKSNASEVSAAEKNDASKPCKKQPCTVCPPGQVSNGKGGCVAGQPSTQNCSVGFAWNGTSCITAANNIHSCPQGERWNGQACIPDPSQCVGYSARGQSVTAEAQAIKDQILQSSCTRTSMTALCRNLYAQLDSIHARYLALQGETPVACGASLPVLAIP